MHPLLRTILQFSITIFCISPSLYAQTINSISSTILISNDDAEEHIDGTMDLSSSDLEMSWEEDVQTVGLRFQNITLPPHAKVQKAWIQFSVDEVSDEETKLNIYVEENPNPTFFMNTPFNITSRKRSKVHIVWKPAPWRKTDERGEAQRTPDLSRLVQHLVDMPSWHAGNSMVFIINGAGKRVAKAFTDNRQESIAETATLHILYSEEKTHPSLQPAPKSPALSPLKSKVRLNELLAANGETDWDPDKKRFSDWIELYNETNTTVDLGGTFLSDDPKNPKKWRIPDDTTLPPHGYLRIWADGFDLDGKALHTNFKLRQKGGVLLLSNKNGILIDKLIYPKLPADLSFGLYHAKKGFMTPTPGKANALAHAKSKRTKKPHFATPSGFYKAPVTVALSHKKEAAIYFTLDGSTPTPSSRRYTKPFKLYETTLVRAIAVEKGKFPSPVTMHTYLINENISLPVVSIGVDPAWLYNKEIGIVTHYEEHWVRKASIEYLIKGKSAFEANVGLKISGNNTRDLPQKSFAVLFRKRFGPKALHYPLFDDKPWIKKIRSFTLRNGGTYWGRSLISEGVSHRILMKQMDIDAQAYQPAILFLNGTYQGIYNIRERMNEDYIRANHHLKGKIDLIEHDETYDTIKAGNIDAWYALLDQMRTKDTSQKSIYEAIAAQLDLDEIINHAVAESFFGNSSIQHNVKHWRLRKEGAKWRALLWDLDRGFDQPTDPVLGYLMDESSTNIPFNALIRNSEFQNRFLSCYFTHLATTFRPERMARFIDNAAEAIAPEVPRHFRKWPEDYDSNSVSLQTWREEIARLHRFAAKRSKIVADKLRLTFNLKGMPKLHISKSEGGYIKVEGVPLEKEFTGSYFDGARLTLEALPNKGCRFMKWSNGEKKRRRTVMLQHDRNVTAHFRCDR